MNGTFLVSDSGVHMNFGVSKPLNSSTTGVLQMVITGSPAPMQRGRPRCAADGD